MSEFDPRDYTARHFEQSVAGIVRRLHGLAEQVERNGRPRDTASFDGTPRFASAAQTVLHDLAWGVANLCADTLVIEAAAADRAEAGDDQ